MSLPVIIAGVYIAARVVSFLANELREDEIQRQNDIRAHLDSYNQTIVRYKQEKIAQVEQESQDEIIHIYTNRRNYLLGCLQERIQEYSTMQQEIQETLNAVRDALRAKDQVHTHLRYNSLQLLLRQLTEAREKCKGYRQYLKDYKKALNRWGAFMEKVPPFEMCLPTEYPYAG